MPSIRISKDQNDKLYFVTCTIQNWYYILDRHNRWDILCKSLIYCQKNKNLEIFDYVFMINHIHLIVRADDLIRVICDFKKYTSRELMNNIIATEPNTYTLFPKKNDKYKIWQETNMPELIESEKFYSQKKQYIINNPVKKQYVDEPEYWYWSSANPNQPISLSSIQ